MRAMGTCVALFTGLAGCGKQGPAVSGRTDKDVVQASHHGWWCDEHGVKEAECSMCDPKVAKACQAKGDWCKDHLRAKSQCFLCDPSLKDTYAAEYRVKYGKEPPEPEGQKASKQ